MDIFSNLQEIMTNLIDVIQGSFLILYRLFNFYIDTIIAEGKILKLSLCKGSSVQLSILLI